jgi:hypothetical protein
MRAISASVSRGIVASRNFSVSFMVPPVAAAGVPAARPAFDRVILY